MKVVKVEGSRVTFGDPEQVKKTDIQGRLAAIAADKAKPGLTQAQKLDIAIQQNDIIIELLQEIMPPK